MDSFEINKIAGGVLGTAMVILAVSIVADMIFNPHEAEEEHAAVVEGGAEPTNAEAAGGGTASAVVALLQNADVSAGEAISRRCSGCHSFDAGGETKVGPNLYGVVGGPVAHVEGFAYSAPFQALHAEGATWTYERLDEFLTNPRAMVPETAMFFPGLEDPAERADLIAYLRSLADTPAPLPEGGAQQASAEPMAPEPMAPAPAAAGDPVIALLPGADASAGEALARRCAGCHSFDEGGPTKVGPNLYGVVGRPVGHVDGFSYSAGMQQLAAGGTEWTYEELSKFLTDPRAMIPDTAMFFPGFQDPAERADVIAYLRTLAATPVPLPDPAHSEPLPPPN